MNLRYNIFIKKQLLIMIALTMIISIPACKKKEKLKNINESQLTDIVLELLDAKIFDTEMVKVDPQVTRNLYNLTNEKDEVVVSYMGTGATSDEITIISSDDTAKLKSTAANYIASRTESFSSELPKEADKLENAIIIQYKKQVLICVSNNKAVAKDLISENTK